MPSATASQTIGPYWHLIDHPEWSDLTRFGADGEMIGLSGRIRDGRDAPISDAAVEIWQSDPPANAVFPGYGRCRADAAGQFRFITLQPGPVAGRGNALQAPHILLAITARGLMKPLFTRVYFDGEPLNETDPLLASIEPPARRQSLIAHRAGDDWELEIRLQGDGETVFLEL